MNRCLLTLSFSVLLLSASLASAQPWQWERYEGTFWHQPESPYVFDLQWDLTSFTVGDFDGNGRDDIVNCYSLMFTRRYLDENGQWNIETGNGRFYDRLPESPPRFCAVDLDSNGTDELLCFADEDIYCHELVSTEPWIWRRSDNLSRIADFPGFPNPSVFGDFDGDGLFEGASYCFANHYFRVYERSADASWTETWSERLVGFGNRHLLRADFDNDGDDDFGVLGRTSSSNLFNGYYVNDDGFLYVPHAADEMQFNLSVRSVFGGDFDGDSDDEVIANLPSDGFFILAEVQADDSFFNVIVPEFRTPNSFFIGHETIDGETRLYSYFNHWLHSYFDSSAGNRRLDWSQDSWISRPSSSFLGFVFEGNSADLENDGYSERLTRSAISGPLYGEYEEWFINPGAGGYVISTSRFSANEDTVFSNPRIANIESDALGELVVNVIGGAPPGIYFYEIDSPIFHSAQFIHRPDLSEGLPTNVGEFTLGDIDNDGQAELIANVNGGWRAYFRRHGRWELYPNILPAGIGNGINLVDFDNDGDLDIISQNGVWLSLSPSPSTEDFILSPLSFILSAYPNPFNATTTIRFDLPIASRVVLDVFNINGQKVQSLADQPYTAGTHTLEFDGSRLSSGLYFLRLQSQDFVRTTKLVLLK